MVKKKTKKTFIQKAKKVALIVLCIVLGLMLFGFIYENVSEYIDSKTLTPPGQIVDVNGHKMHIYCTGENNGKPTVILESGAGGNYYDWYKIQPNIAKYTKVCSYDRAGIGFSDTTNNKHNNLDVAKELQNLLNAANVPSPYILVGHSLGGFNIRLYTDKNKTKVAGMVFVDSSVPEMATFKPTFLDKIIYEANIKLLVFSSYTGLVRLVMTINPNMYAYPTDTRLLLAGIVTPKQFIAGSKEVSDSNINFEEVRKTNNFGVIPITVLTAKGSADVEPFWKEWQQNLSKISQNGKQIIVPNSNHYIHIDQPQVVIDSILELIPN
ncbi:MAG: alpha/beta hydrolase [bacterium]